MPVRRRQGQAREKPKPTANRRPPGAPATETVEVIRSAAAVFKDKIRADQVESTAGRKLGLPFTIGPVLPIHIRPINAMFYGDYGFGKTSMAASADDVPSMRDVLFINTDEGTMSITSRRTMDFVWMTAYDQIARIFEFLALHCYYRDQRPRNNAKLLEYEMELKSYIVPVEDQTVTDDYPADPERTWFVEQRLRTGKPMDEPYIYNTVIIDTLTELHRLLIYKFVGIDLNKVKLDEAVEAMDEWREAQEMFVTMIRAFKTLPMHTIFLASMATEPSERNKRRNPRAGQMLPKMPGKAPGEVASLVDIVGFLEKTINTPEEGGGETRRVYLAAGYADWISKHRFENMPDLEYIDVDRVNVTGYVPFMQKLINIAKEDAQHGSSTARISSQLVTVAAPSDSSPVAAASYGSRNANAASGGSGRAGRGNGVRRRHG